MKSQGKSRFSEIQMPVWAVIGLMLLSAQRLSAAQPASADQGESEPATLALSVVDKEAGKPVPDAEIRVVIVGACALLCRLHMIHSQISARCLPGPLSGITTH